MRVKQVKQVKQVGYTSATGTTTNVADYAGNIYVGNLSAPEPPQGLVQRFQEIKTELERCLECSSEIRHTMMGEGEVESGPEKMPPESLDALSHDCLGLVCNLRGELQRVMGRLYNQPNKSAKKAVNV